MKTDASLYLHILPFQCPRCQTPILVWTFSPMRNLESVDATPFEPRCSCGWTGRWLGAQARSHLVLPWSATQNLSAEGVAVEGAIEGDTGNAV